MSGQSDNPPYIYFSGENVHKYSEKSKQYVIQQKELVEKAWDYLQLEESELPYLILDIGCGAGVGGAVLNTKGAVYVGVDIAPEMLLAGASSTTENFNVFIRADGGKGVPFRQAVFDACIGIDVLNFLLKSYSEDEIIHKRLKKFFESVYCALSAGGRCVFNFNPSNDDEKQLVVNTAETSGFNCTCHDLQTQRKYECWIVLSVGGGLIRDDDDDGTGIKNQKAFVRNKYRKKGPTNKERILQKKEYQRKIGKEVPNDSKYTGRSRRRWI